MIRAATPADLEGILAIHNAAIAETTAIWDTEPADLADRREWLEQRVAAEYPVLVAEIDGRVAGYASYAQWRPKSGYRFCVENSVYVGSEFRRRGVARALLTELLALAEKSGAVRVMVALIESTNTMSIALHEQFGFRVTGSMPEVGRKFGRWLDLTIMQIEFPAPAVDRIESGAE
ncbi:N-acetyltransferase family protein [Nocardia stercoris]|uniref:N-acetyltransferase family protein n=2 Tax=Nocardia stercoris TaxID=2483361 RepID=A0A3M2KW56_9NOCA|nr:GNAT family N-acetyltransferase [Nocardia stercoris]RMI27725.1 N-acetyltransferase family protein [Nocardia stercoris]